MCLFKMMAEYIFILFYNGASLREGTETSASDQDDDPEPGDAIVSSNTSVPPQGPSGRYSKICLIAAVSILIIFWIP